MAGENYIEKIENINAPIRWGIYFGTIALFAGLFFWFVYKPINEKIITLDDNIQALERKVAQAVKKAKNKDRLNAEKAQADAQFNEALKLLPDSKEIPGLLKKVTELGDESGLEFRVFTPKSERAKDFYVEIPVAIEVQGPYHNVGVFFSKIGRMERIMNIYNVKMNPVSSNSSVLKTTCDAVTYRFKGSNNVKQGTTNKKSKK